MSHVSIAAPAMCHSGSLELQHLHRLNISSTMSLHSAMHSDSRLQSTHASEQSKWQHGAEDVNCLTHCVLSSIERDCHDDDSSMMLAFPACASFSVSSFKYVSPQSLSHIQLPFPWVCMKKAQLQYHLQAELDV